MNLHSHHRITARKWTRANRRVTLLVRIAELRKIVPVAEEEGKDSLANACRSDIALHEERLDDLAVGICDTSSNFFSIIFPNIFKTQIPYW